LDANESVEFGVACTKGPRHTLAEEHVVMIVEQRAALDGEVEPGGHAVHELAPAEAA
jgi:hypothetical protein